MGLGHYQTEIYRQIDLSEPVNPRNPQPGLSTEGYGL